MNKKAILAAVVFLSAAIGFAVFAKVCFIQRDYCAAVVLCFIDVVLLFFGVEALADIPSDEVKNRIADEMEKGGEL